MGVSITFTRLATALTSALAICFAADAAWAQAAGSKDAAVGERKVATPATAAPAAVPGVRQAPSPAPQRAPAEAPTPLLRGSQTPGGLRDYDVGIRKQGPGTSAAGQSATFTLSPYNTGPSPVDPSTGATVTDTLPSNFAPPVTFTAGPGWNCTVSGLTLTCLWTGAPVGASQPFPQITVTAKAATAGGYTNCAIIAIKPVDVRPNDNRSCIDGKITPAVQRGYDVGITKKGPGTTVAGQSATFGLLPVNIGPSSVDSTTGVWVTDTLPANFSPPLTYTAGAGWTCTVSGLLLSCHWTGGTIGANQPFPQITVAAMAKGTGDYTNCANIVLKAEKPGGATTDTDPKNNQGCVTGVITPGKPTGYDVGITKTGPASIAAGQTASFVLHPVNVGPATVGPPTGVTVTDTLPSNFVPPLTYSAPGGWTCNVAGLTITCHYVGPAVTAGNPLPIITISAVAKSPGDYRNCADIALRRILTAGDGADPVVDTYPGNNEGCVPGVVTPGKPTGYDVGITKTGPASIAAGQSATFTLAAYNVGPTAVNSTTGVTVTDMLPSDFAGPVSFVAPGWTCTVSGLSFSCQYMGAPVPAGQPLPPIAVTAVAKTPGDYRNCAAVAVPGDSNIGNNNSCVPGVINPVIVRGYDVGIDKKAPTGPVIAGQSATFSLFPRNNGPSSVDSTTGVTVTDTLPASFSAPVTYTAGAGWTCTVSGLTLSCHWTGGTVGANQAMPQITVTATAKAAGDYTNCATIAMNPRYPTDRVASGPTDTNPKDNQSCVNGVINPVIARGYDVGIDKKAPTGPVIAGQSATFNLFPRNNGPSSVDANTGVTVTDTLPASFSAPVTYTAGAGWTCTVSGLTLTCHWTGGAVGANQAMPQITVTATAKAAGDYTNCATIALNPEKPGERITDTNLSDNRSCVNGVINPVLPRGYDVGVTKKGPGSTAAGQLATFDLSPYNTGPSSVDATAGVTVTDTLPANFSPPLTYTAGAGWTCTVAGLTLTCHWTGGMAAASQAMPLITVTATAKTAGPYINCADISLKPTDAKPSDNQSCVNGIITPVLPRGYDVGVTKKGPGSTAAGQLATFDLSPYNTGPSSVDATTGVTVTDTLPSTFSAPVTYTAGAGWTCTVSGLTLTCHWTGGMVAASQALPLITVTATAKTAGPYINCADIALKPTDAKPGDNQSCVNGIITPVLPRGYDVGIEKKGPGTTVAGQGVTFGLFPRNNGPSPVDSTTGVWVTDTLPANFVPPVTYAAGVGWTCTVSGLTLSCHWTGGSVGASQAMPQITVTATAKTAGDYINCANIAFKAERPGGGPIDTNPKDNQSCVNGVITPVVARGYDVGIEKKGPGTTVAGQSTTFGLFPYNTGPTPVDAGAGVTVTDTLPANFVQPLTYTAGTGWTCNVLGLTLTCHWTGGTVAANQAMPQISVTATAKTAGDYTNCADIAIKPTDVKPSDNRSCINGVITPVVLRGYDVGIEKKGPGTTVAGQSTTFGLFPYNTGPTPVDANTGVTVTDTLPANFTTPVTFTAGPGWTCNVLGLTLTCHWTGGTVGASQAMSQISVTATAKTAGDYTNCADIAIKPTDVKPSDNRSCINGVITPVIVQSYNVGLQKTGPGTTPAGQTTTFGLLARNEGPAPVDAATGATITDTLPANFIPPLTYTAPAGWTCTTAGLTLTCHWGGGVIAANQTFPQVTVTAKAQTAGSYTNCAELTITPTDTNPRDNGACVTGGVTQAGKPTSVCVLKYNDLNGNGVLDPGEPALANWQFTIRDSTNALVAQDVTNANGVFCTSPSMTLAPGPYSVTETMQPGWVSTNPGGATPQKTVTVVAGQTVQAVFGNQLAKATTQSFSIEKVVDQDCSGGPPYTLCKFTVRVFNNGPGTYTGPLTFTDLVTSFGNPTGGVTLVTPLPIGWTCTGVQPLSCTTTNSVTIPMGGFVMASLNMNINGAVPPDKNCASLTAPAAAGPSCVPVGKTHLDLLIDSNFMNVPGAPGFHEVNYYVSSTPQLATGAQIVLTGSLTSAGVTFTPWTVLSPGWTCSGTWASFVCTTTVGSGSSILTLKTSYPTGAMGHPFTYAGTVTVNNNTDPNPSNSTRSETSILP